MLFPHCLFNIFGLIQVLGGFGILHFADTGRIQISSVKVGPGDVGIGKICRCQLTAAKNCAGEVGSTQRSKFHQGPRHVRSLEGRAVELGALEGTSHETHGLVLFIGREVCAIKDGLGHACIGEIASDPRLGKVSAVKFRAAELRGEEACSLEVRTRQIGVQTTKPDRGQPLRDWLP